MRRVIYTTLVVCGLAVAPVIAGNVFAEESAHVASFSTAKSTFGELLDNGATKEVLLKHIPRMVNSPMAKMARGKTLRELQTMGAPSLTKDVLTAIDADLANIH